MSARPHRYFAWLLILALPACDLDDPAAADPATVASAAAEVTTSSLTMVPGVSEVVGETGPGSTYALFRPADWNGELVVYAHGYVQPHVPVGLPPEITDLRDYLLLNGFAVAYSSWSETGYAVKDGAQRTHQLKGLFAEAFDRPARIYLMGTSLGGLVVEMLSERFAPQYDGTLALCGVLAGGLWNAEYVADFRVLFDYFYPGVLPGTLFDMPEGYLVAEGSPAFLTILSAVASNPLPAVEMAAMDQIRLQYNNDINELITGFIHVLGYQVNGANALRDRLNGKSFFDNTATRYTGSSDDDALNAAVARYHGNPSAVNYFDHWWQPQGRIARPFLTLHTTRDAIVPFRVQDAFAATVADAGRDEWLVQRGIDRFGHCTFEPMEVVGAFHELVAWVRSGQRPAS